MTVSQTSTVIGDGNIIVQATGDHTQIVVGRAHLCLTRQDGRADPDSDLGLLKPFTRATPLVGREEENKSLDAFLAGDARIRARVLVGGGGSGKTRLALELCHRLDGWNAGFVTRGELKRFFAQQNLAEWGWQRPTLIVVDYAAEHADSLREWLDELIVTRRGAGHSLRLLLLERTATTDSGWLREVFATGDFGIKRALLHPPEPVKLAPLRRLEDRTAVLEAMLQQRGLDASAAHSPAVQQQLAQLEWAGDPLFLMMAASSSTGLVAALVLDRTDLATDLAQQEQNRLMRLAESRGLRGELPLHLAACVTLAQGMDRDEFERFAADEKVAVNRPGGGDAADLADLLVQALPRGGSGIAAVQPDLNGEEFLLLQAKKPQWPAAVLRVWQRAGQRVAETVIRCAMDFAQRDASALRWLESMVADAESQNEERLELLNRSIPFESVTLRDVNLEVARRLHALVAADPNAATERSARALGQLSIALAMSGDRDEALDTARQAVDLYGRLAQQRPDVFEPDLAMSLNNLANTLSQVGSRDEALDTARQAVELRRRLAQQRPDVFEPDLATSLNNLANMLSEVGRRDEALDTARQAVDLYRRHAQERPDVFDVDLGRALIVHALCLEKSGDDRQAAEVAASALRTAMVPFLRWPDSLAGLVLAMARDYVRLCEASGIEPDVSLLEPLIPFLGKPSEGETT